MKPLKNHAINSLIGLLFCLVMININPVSAQITTTLNFPTDGNKSINQTVVFNCSALTTVGSLQNISLWENSTGIFKINQTTGSLGFSQAHGLDLSVTAEQQGYFGLRIVPNKNLVLQSMTRAAGDLSLNCTLLDYTYTPLNTSVFSGDTCLISYNLVASTIYYVTGTCGVGVNCANRQRGTTNSFYNVSQTYVNWTGALEDNTFDTTSKAWTIESISVASNSSTQTFTQNYSNGNFIKWNCQACASDGTCNFSSANYTFSLDYPNITILSPDATVTSATILINATINSTYGNSYCYYNITRGASVEVANTPLNCSQANSTATLSGAASYVLNVFANNTGGLISVSNLAFTYTPSGVTPPASPGGGGGARIVEENTTVQTGKLCDATNPAFQDAWDKFKSEKSWSNFVPLWHAYWDNVLCKSAASLIPGLI